MTLQPLIDLLGSSWGGAELTNENSLMHYKEREEVTDLGARADGGGAAVSLGSKAEHLL